MQKSPGCTNIHGSWYNAIAQHLEEVLADTVRRQVSAWGPTLDATIAELMVSALVANGAPGEPHLVDDRADVRAWHVRTDEKAPFVAVVEGPGLCAYAFLPDVQPASVHALVDHLLAT